jgi:hypothetical protein
MDDRLLPSGGTRAAAFQAFRTGSSSLEELRLRRIEVNKVNAGFMPSPHDAGFHILILEINVFNKRSALQVKRSLSAALAAPL